jgi:hypothetical protein
MPVDRRPAGPIAAGHERHQAMNGSFWHDLSIRVGRALPPLARLHDQRNALQEQAAAFAEELDRLHGRKNASEQHASMLEQELARLREQKIALEEHAAQERTQLRRELEQFRENLDYLSARRKEGFLAEFDYPYMPKVRDWDRSLAGNCCGRLITAGIEQYRAQLTAILACQQALVTVPRDEPTDECEPFWSNSWFPPLDAICLSGLLVALNPRHYVEVGSGNSTKFARRAIADHDLRTKIISIDPQPRAIVDSLCDRVVRHGLENCDLAIFAELGADDLLFIDNSHRSFQNSDVTVFFTEILPLLKPGCHYGIHDIFLPYDYPATWLSRLYNEQYLLMAYLLGGAAGDRIVLPVHFVERTPELFAILEPITHHPALRSTPAVGGAFWMVKA